MESEQIIYVKISPNNSYFLCARDGDCAKKIPIEKYAQVRDSEKEIACPGEKHCMTRHFYWGFGEPPAFARRILLEEKVREQA
jgi:uncharacterized CHY-type Zn-finger protein